MEKKEKELIEKTYTLAKENHSMLKKMRRGMLWGRVFRIFYWTIILGSMVGVYYYLQPVIESLGDTYNSLKETVSGLPDIGSLFGN